VSDTGFNPPDAFVPLLFLSDRLAKLEPLVERACAGNPWNAEEYASNFPCIRGLGSVGSATEILGSVGSATEILEGQLQDIRWVIRQYEYRLHGQHIHAWTSPEASVVAVQEAADLIDEMQDLLAKHGFAP
jgi:hypothetical protein